MKTKKEADSYKKGYSRGLTDALTVIQSLMENNGLHLDEKEFFKEMKNLREEGKL